MIIRDPLLAPPASYLEAITFQGQVYYFEAAGDYNLQGLPLDLRTYLTARQSNTALANTAAFLSRENAKRQAALADFIAKGSVPLASKAALRKVAQSQGRLTALDTAVAAVSDPVWKVRWEEGDTFTRTDLNALSSVSAANLDLLFNAAKDI